MKHARAGTIAGAVIIALALLLANTAKAASTLEFKAVPVAAEGKKGICGRVYAGPRSVITIGGRGDRCPLDAQEIARRLNVLAEGGLRAGAIEARRDGRGHSIYADGQRIVHIDKDLARFHRSSPEALGKVWAKNLREQFGRPYLSVAPVVVPVGEARAVKVKGNIALPVRVRAESGAVTASYDAAEEMVHVFGNWVGETELVVADERSLLRVPVRAAKWAGRLPAQLSARVTGRPAPQDTIGRAVKAATVDGLVLEPGAWASVNPMGGADAAAGARTVRTGARAGERCRTRAPPLPGPARRRGAQRAHARGAGGRTAGEQLAGAAALAGAVV
jgi:hypothetical protein